jgi:hypothetical protein
MYSFRVVIYFNILKNFFLERNWLNMNLDYAEIRHMVIFCLKHEKGSDEEKSFFSEADQKLGCIPGVQEFRIFRQISTKNDYDYGFTMKFSNHQSYDSYNKHPNHVAFVENHWKKEVTRFMEIDFSERV